jgi:cyclic dehypoxanthinyl futalosine synthase
MNSTTYHTESSQEVISLLDKGSRGGWLNFEEGLAIFRGASTEDLKTAASARTEMIWGGKDSPRTFLKYHLLNYSNVCAENCSFCNYWAGSNSPDAWTYTFEDVEEELQSYYDYGGRVILFQGGNNYAIKDFSYYTTFISKMVERFPDFYVYGTSPTEIFFWSNHHGISIPEIFRQLKQAGLRGIAGAGGEIAHQPIRDLMFKRKVTFETWLDIMDEACAHGLSSSASMMFGTYDGLDDRFEAEFCRLEHMDLLRQRQGHTSHYRAFVAWPYQPNQGRIRDKAAPHEEYVRLMSMARLYMRNFPNLQSSYLSLSKEQFQDSLNYAVNCSGGILYTPELVTGSVGANPNHLSRNNIVDWISGAGYRPEERDYYGRILSDPYTGRSPMNESHANTIEG